MKELDSSAIIDRCREPGSGFRQIRRNGFNGLMLENGSFSEDQLFAALDQFEELPPDAPELRKNSRKIRAAVLHELFFKKYNPRGFFYYLRHAMMLTRPERVLSASLRLREFEIPTPEVVAVFRRYRWGLPYCDYLITRALSPSLHLCNASEMVKIFSQGDGYRQFLGGTVSLLAKMHSAGLEHGDLNLRNLFCRKNPSGAYSDWGVIDLDGSEIYPEEMPITRRRKELARIISSFLRSVKAAAPRVPVTINQTIWDFARKYQELTGLNLSGEALDGRVRMLTKRERKDKKQHE